MPPNGKRQCTLSSSWPSTADLLDGDESRRTFTYAASSDITLAVNSVHQQAKYRTPQKLITSYARVIHLVLPKSLRRYEKMQTYERGNRSEGVVLSAYINAELIVSIPFGTGASYDLVVDTATRLLKIQVKTAWLDG